MKRNLMSVRLKAYGLNVTSAHPGVVGEYAEREVGPFLFTSVVCGELFGHHAGGQDRPVLIATKQPGNIDIWKTPDGVSWTDIETTIPEDKAKNVKRQQKRAAKRHKRAIRPNKGHAKDTALGVQRAEVRRKLGRG